MANENESGWPLPKFYFFVKYRGMEFSFQEVSGLENNTTVNEYRTQAKPGFNIKLPEAKKFRNVTLKKGASKENGIVKDFYSDFSQTIMASPMVIELLDESATAVFVWTLEDAYPIRIETVAMSSTTPDIAIESMEIAFTTITVTKQ